MPSRWDFLFDQKPIPLMEHLVQEASQRLGDDVLRWPLPIQEVDPTVGQTFLPLVSGQLPKPGPDVLREAFRLARWDLSHEVQAYDDYMRHHRWSEAGLTS